MLRRRWCESWVAHLPPKFLVENPKCIFIHIPKTGGTSIRKGVFNLYGRNVRSKWEDVPAAWKKCFKFAFVRNPYDRFVSGWKYFKGEKFLSFADFVQIATGELSVADVCSLEDLRQGFPARFRVHGGVAMAGFESLVESITRSICHHTMPQYNHLKHANFVGRFENLQEDFDKICGRLNIPKQKLPHLNKTNHKHYSSYYNKKIKMMADQYYEEDLQKLGYHFNKEWL